MMEPKEKNRDIKPVSFNLKDKYEKELRNFAIAQHEYFSRYVKRLIEKDKREKEGETYTTYRKVDREILDEIEFESGEDEVRLQEENLKGDKGGSRKEVAAGYL